MLKIHTARVALLSGLIMAAIAASAQASTIADFGTFATNPETTVGPDVPLYANNTLAIYGPVSFTANSAYNPAGTGFEGFNLNHVVVDSTQDVLVRARAFGGTTPSGPVQFEFYGPGYQSSLFLNLETSQLTSDYAIYNLGSFASQGFNPGFLDGLQITNVPQQVEVDYITTAAPVSTVPEPASMSILAVSLGGLLLRRRK